MSIPNDISTYEKMANMKNIIGDSFIELLKQSIKNNQNENVIKMLDMTKEKPETFLELLPVAILNQNFEIVKYMVEKFKITEADTPSMNALSFVNSIYPDNSKNKINEPKDNYLLIQSPFILICGIGGNIEIYKFLLNNKLISDKKQVGFIGLSKKYKNLVYSNVVGACAYYGKHEILEFILKAPKNELDVNNINIPTTEKKSKNNSRLFVKEFTGLTPCMLAIVGPCSDLQTIDVLKKLINYHAKFDALDLNKDNLLHLATKNKKIETAKYLIDELNLKNLLNETNKEGQTPLSLAQHLKDKVFISYYNEKTGIDEKEIEENLKELINESNKSNKNNNKKKKNKKNKNNDTVTLLNTTEYQESLKVDNTSEKNYSSTYSNTNSKNTYNSSNNRIKLHALLDNPKPKKKKEKQENNKVEKEEKKVENNVEDKKEEEKKEDIKEEEHKEAEKDTKTKKIQNTQPDEDEEVIVGLSIKKHKKKNKGKKNKDNENEQNKEKELEEKRKKEEEEKEKEKQRKKEEEEEKKRIEEEKRKKQEEEEKQRRIEEEKRQKEEEEKRKKEEEEKRQKEEEEKKRRQEEEERARKQKEEEEKRAKEEEEERKKKLNEEQKEKEKEEKKKKEEEEKKKKEKEEKKKKEEEEKKKKDEEKKRNQKKEEKTEEEEEEEEDYSYSDEENFLDDGDNSEKEEKKEKPKIINQKDYETLNKNYFELERKILLLEKEKEELASCLKKLYLEKKANANIPITSNNEENINDLMFLVNKELENKDNIIHDLEGKVSKVDLRNIENFSKEELLEYKDFYTKNLKIINEAMKKY